MRMAAVSTERPVVGPHCHAKASGDRLLTERQVTRTLDQVLQKQIVGAFFAVAQLELQAVELEPRFTADVDLRGRWFVAFHSFTPSLLFNTCSRSAIPAPGTA